MLTREDCRLTHFMCNELDSFEKMLTITFIERLRYIIKMREIVAGLSPISFLFFYVYIQPESGIEKSTLFS